MPFMFGVIRDTTGTFIVGQLFTAGLVVLAMVIVLFMRQDPTPDRPPPTGSR
jgi:cyanate permease